MKIGKILQSASLASYPQFLQEIAKFLLSRNRTITISPSFSPRGGGKTLKFIFRRDDDLEIVTLQSPLVLARRLSELGIEKIVLASPSRQADVGDLMKQIIDPSPEKNIRDFNRPNIEIHFKHEKQAGPPVEDRPIQAPLQPSEIRQTKEDNPFSKYSAYTLYRFCRKIERGRKIPHTELVQLKDWLEHVLDGNNFLKYYVGSEREYFRTFFAYLNRSPIED